MQKDKQACRATRLIFLAFGLGISSWAPMVPFAKARAGLDDTELGLVLLVSGIGALVAMPLAGWLIQRFGSRLITLLSSLLLIAILPLLAIASTPLTLSLTLFLYGAGAGALNVSINAQAVDVEAKSGISLMSGFHCLFSLGGFLGAVIVIFLLEAKIELLFCALAISLIMALIIIFQWKNLLPLSKAKQASHRQSKFTFPESKVILLGFMCFIAFMAEGSVHDWSAEFLLITLHYDASIVGIGYALFSISMACGRLIGDKLIQRLGVIFVFQMGSLMAASGFFTVIYLGLGYAELLGFCLIGLGASNIVPIIFSTSGRLSANSNYSLTVVTTIGYIGSLVGPAFIGFVAQATTLSFAFASIALLLITVGMTSRR